MANKTMRHWNANQLCAFDLETTGLDPDYHEICQVALLPLDAELDERRDVLPFSINLIPDHPDRIDSDAMKVSSLKLPDLIRTGHDQLKGVDLLEQWIEKLNLPYNKSGYNRTKIMLLGHNMLFDLPFFKKWLGPELFEHYFHPWWRDTMAVAAYLADNQGFRGERVMYPKYNLQYLATQHKIQRTRAHDALFDCRVTAQIYKKMCGKMVL